MKIANRSPLFVCCVAALELLTGFACQREDLGKECGTEPEAVPPEAIANEDPLPEVVRLERDGVCESFQCLTHQGLQPYCTRECRADRGADAGGECEVDADCADSALCQEGTCRQHNCPKGFACRHVQVVGPLAAARYCVFQQGCSTNFDCGDLGKIDCQRFGCLSSCALSEEDTCEDERLVCKPYGDLACTCPEGGSDCSDAELICEPPGRSLPLAQGTVTRQSYCIPNDP